VTKQVIGALTVAASLLAMTIAGPIMAENTFTKIGKAIQYTTRKDSENLSQSTHQALGHNSVHHNRTGVNAHTRYVLKPNGAKYRIYHHHHHKMHTM